VDLNVGQCIKNIKQNLQCVYFFMLEEGAGGQEDSCYQMRRERNVCPTFCIHNYYVCNAIGPILIDIAKDAFLEIFLNVVSNLCIMK
jgi:hypothetical protein